MQFFKLLAYIIMSSVGTTRALAHHQSLLHDLSSQFGDQSQSLCVKDGLQFGIGEGGFNA